MKASRLEYKSMTGWRPLPECSIDKLPPDCEVRIKPEPKLPTLRSWEPEEIPVGALIRCKRVNFGSYPASLILAGRGAWVYFVCPETAKQIEILTTVLAATSDYEHSLDHGKTWLPCGVVE